MNAYVMLLFLETGFHVHIEQPDVFFPDCVIEAVGQGCHVAGQTLTFALQRKVAARSNSMGLWSTNWDCDRSS